MIGSVRFFVFFLLFLSGSSGLLHAVEFRLQPQPCAREPHVGRGGTEVKPLTDLHEAQCAEVVQIEDLPVTGAQPCEEGVKHREVVAGLERLDAAGAAEIHLVQSLTHRRGPANVIHDRATRCPPEIGPELASLFERRSRLTSKDSEEGLLDDVFGVELRLACQPGQTLA